MLSIEEFERTLSESKDIIEKFISDPSGDFLDICYDLGVRLTHVAIYVKEERMLGEFDSRMLIFRLAEALVETSFMLDMGKLSGVSPALSTPDACAKLAAKKVADVFVSESFVGNEYDGESPFPNLFHGIDYAAEFIDVLPSLSQHFSSLPREMLSWALTGDTTKVTAMMLWAAVLANDRGATINDLKEMVKKVYSLKYGITLKVYDTQKVTSICNELKPWLKNLREVTVGGRQEKCLN